MRRGSDFLMEIRSFLFTKVEKSHIIKINLPVQLGGLTGTSFALSGKSRPLSVADGEDFLGFRQRERNERSAYTK